MKKIILIITVAVVALMVVAGASMYCLFHQQYAAAQSVEQVGDKMYTMTYEGDYGLDEFLEQGGATCANDIAAFVCRHLFYGLVSPDATPAEFGCSFITTKDKDGKVLTGRNFDWPDCKSPIVIVHTHPDMGYASVSTSCISFPMQLPE